MSFLAHSPFTCTSTRLWRAACWNPYSTWHLFLDMIWTMLRSTSVCDFFALRTTQYLFSKGLTIPLPWATPTSHRKRLKVRSHFRHCGFSVQPKCQQQPPIWLLWHWRMHKSLVMEHSVNAMSVIRRSPREITNAIFSIKHCKSGLNIWLITRWISHHCMWPYILQRSNLRVAHFFKPYVRSNVTYRWLESRPQGHHSCTSDGENKQIPGTSRCIVVRHICVWGKVFGISKQVLWHTRTF